MSTNDDCCEFKREFEESIAAENSEKNERRNECP